MEHPAAPHQPPSLDQYLELERDAQVRHEFVGGQLRAMTGATRRHNTIAGNIFSAFRQAAKGTPWRGYMSDVKVLIPENVAYYPDVMVTCAPESSDPYVVTEPCLIVEVTSSTTQNKDRREKLAAYRTIPALKAYLIVDQDRQCVERHFRHEEGGWLHTTAIGESTIPVPCPDGMLALADIYEGL
jgi:Uma2 family endonuclease